MWSVGDKRSYHSANEYTFEGFDIVLNCPEVPQATLTVHYISTSNWRLIGHKAPLITTVERCRPTPKEMSKLRFTESLWGESSQRDNNTETSLHIMRSSRKHIDVVTRYVCRSNISRHLGYTFDATVTTYPISYKTYIRFRRDLLLLRYMINYLCIRVRY